MGMGGDFGLPSSMGGGMTGGGGIGEGTLGGVTETNADMNMGESNATSGTSAPAESGTENPENGGMPDINFP